MAVKCSVDQGLQVPGDEALGPGRHHVQVQPLQRGLGCHGAVSFQDAAQQFPTTHLQATEKE